MTIQAQRTENQDPCPRQEKPSRPHFSTIAARSAIESDQQHGAIVPPLHLSSNFSFDGFDNKRTYDYTRSGNPTRSALAQALADLEGGHGATVTASGMAAVNLVCQLLRPGDRLLAPHDCYGGSYRLFTSLAERGQFEVAFVNQSDPTVLERAFEQHSPTLIWVETPSNPLLRITDLALVARMASEHGSLVVVDNTFLSPALQRPFEHGADLIVHSTTKYLNGHSDVVGGAVVARTPELHADLEFWSNCLGITGAPFDSYLTLRGLRTLPARLRIHEENATAVVELLSRHPAVRRLYHPSLPDHPGHQVARRQQAGFGAMLSFELEGDRGTVAAFLEQLTCFSLAESLGGVESLVAHPATMTHASMDEEARRVAGIGDTLLRLSVGIEDARDLVADLERALDAVSPARQLERTAVG